jgi:hypothetical protein
MDNINLVTELNHSLALQLPDHIALEALQEKLAEYVNTLIKNNFEDTGGLIV